MNNHQGNMLVFLVIQTHFMKHMTQFSSAQYKFFCLPTLTAKTI